MVRYNGVTVYHYLHRVSNLFTYFYHIINFFMKLAAENNNETTQIECAHIKRVTMHCVKVHPCGCICVYVHHVSVEIYKCMSGRIWLERGRRRRRKKSPGLLTLRYRALLYISKFWVLICTLWREKRPKIDEPSSQSVSQSVGPM